MNRGPTDWQKWLGLLDLEVANHVPRVKTQLPERCHLDSGGICAFGESLYVDLQTLAKLSQLPAPAPLPIACVCEGTSFWTRRAWSLVGMRICFTAYGRRSCTFVTSCQVLSTNKNNEQKNAVNEYLPVAVGFGVEETASERSLNKCHIQRTPLVVCHHWKR